MRAIGLLLVLLCLDDERAVRFHAQIRFQSPDAESDEGRRVVAVLFDKEHWTGAFRDIESKLGEFPDGIDLSVDFSLDGEELGRAEGRGGKTKIAFNLKKLAEYQKNVDAFEKQKKEAIAQGRRAVYKVPPVKFDRIIYHEMTHLFQRGIDAPKWFIEGMAQLLSDDPNSICAFAAETKTLKGIDLPLFDRNDIYARGHLFWKWLDSRGAVKKTADAAVLQRRPWKAAIEESTGLAWAAVVEMERVWSAKEIEHLRTPEGR